MATERLAFLAHMEREVLRDLAGYKLGERPHTWRWHLQILHLERHISSIQWEREEIYDGVLLHL